jgi:hypothetical protein
MYVDGGIPTELSEAAAAARTAETEGYDALWIAETNHDPFLPLTLAAPATHHVELGTAIAVAFARSPMTPRRARGTCKVGHRGASFWDWDRRYDPTSSAGSPCRGRTRLLA